MDGRRLRRGARSRHGRDVSANRPARPAASAPARQERGGHASRSQPTQFRYRSLGLLVSLGRYKGVAQVAGLRFRGFPAWFLHRTYHVMRIPTFNRKARVIADWTLALFFRRDVVQLGSLQHPREAFAQAIGGSGATEPGRPAHPGPIGLSYHRPGRVAGARPSSLVGRCPRR